MSLRVACSNAAAFSQFTYAFIIQILKQHAPAQLHNFCVVFCISLPVCCDTISKNLFVHVHS